MTDATANLTVREVIEQLQAAAGDMSLGLDSPVIVMLCDGDGAEGSREIEISTLTFISEKDGSTRDFAVMIQGHPHIDRQKGERTRYPGVASDADTALREWAEGTDQEG